jgi:hypothetical protein
MASRTLSLIALVTCVFSSLSIAQQSPSATPPDPNDVTQPTANVPTVTRVYDVRELIRPKRDYPFQSIVIPPMHIGTRQEADAANLNLFGGQSAQPAEAPVNTPGIIGLITKSIGAGSWRDAGGTEGSIAFHDGMLVVTQTQEHQQQIADLLVQLRNELGPARTITIKADWVLLEPGQLATFIKAGKGGPQEVDLAAINKQNLKAHYTGELSCFNGQTVHVASVTGRTMIRDLQPVVAQQAVGYNADVTLAQAGATLQITPQVSKDGTSAVIDVHSLVTEWDEPAKPSAATIPNDGVSPWSLIDRQNVTAQQIRTTLRIPLNKAILIGGMTMSPSLRNQDSSQLYLIIELTSAGE